MTGSAMHISKWASATALASALAATPLAARTQVGGDPNVVDVARTPLTDLNLAKDPIPEVLLTAASAPYANPEASDGIEECDAIGSSIAQIDAVLGPDLDVADAERDDISVGRIAQSAVGSLIPFRSIVREITGAADHQRQFEAAIAAGAIRRGYLKGVGEAKGCAYPARPAFAKIDMPGEAVEWDDNGPALALRSPQPAPEPASAPAQQVAQNEGDDGVTFVSQEVVQGAGE